MHRAVLELVVLLGGCLDVLSEVLNELEPSKDLYGTVSRMIEVAVSSAGCGHGGK